MTAPMSDDLTRLQERVAHLMATVDDLSDVVARQQGELDQLTRRVALLVEREAAREAQETGSEVIADRPPPHY
jgi:Uncharacterized protein conserved in bacteria